ncbi:hypothetical protein C0580_03450 [Candidatus Parcubacteria bacterium]|nr:MAG: hypothetical protein C0580_03450 [Candidatus Parcubacteria bacterium]
MENSNQNLENNSGPTTGLDTEMNQSSGASMPNQDSSIDPVTPPQAGLQERLQQQTDKSKKGGGKLWLIITLVLFLVLLGVAGWWYYAQGQAMLLAKDIKWDWSQGVKNFRSDINVDLTIKNIKDSSGTADMFGAPSSIKLNINNVMHNVDKDLEGSGDYSVYAGGMGIDISLEYKKIGDTFYIKPSPESLDIPLLSLDTSIFADKWIYFSEQEVDEIEGMISQNSGDDGENMQQKNERFLQALKDKKAFDIKDPHESKDTPAGKLKKLQFVIKEDMIDEVMDTAINIYNSDPQESLEKMNKERQDYPEAWDIFKNFVANIDLMVWVNTDTKAIQGMEIGMDNLEYADKENRATLDGNISFLLAAEEPVVISTPVNAFTLEELFEEMMMAEQEKMMMENGGGLEGWGGESVDGEYNPYYDDTDGDGLTDFMENMLGTDPEEADTDGDGYDDMTEFENDYNPLGEGDVDDYKAQVLPLLEEACESTDGTWDAEAENCECPDYIEFMGLQGCLDYYSL